MRTAELALRPLSVAIKAAHLTANQGDRCPQPPFQPLPRPPTDVYGAGPPRPLRWCHARALHAPPGPSLRPRLLLQPGGQRSGRRPELLHERPPLPRRPDGTAAGAFELELQAFDFAGGYRLCVTPPRGERTCRHLTLRRSGGRADSRVGWRERFPDRGRGRYLVTRSREGQRLGPALAFRVR